MGEANASRERHPTTGEGRIMAEEHQRIKVLVETAERSFKGYLYKPIRDERFRLSDWLNSYDKAFINLAEVEVADRGQHYRVGDRQNFVAVQLASITYITPMEPTA
jgi:hypothetical protein